MARLYTPVKTQKGMMELSSKYHMPTWELTRSEIKIAERLVGKGSVGKIDGWSFYIYHAKPTSESRKDGYGASPS